MTTTFLPFSMSTKLPGFQDAVHDAQQSFRRILEALSQPGTMQTITAEIVPPQSLMPASAVICLTLFDLEVTVWLQSSLDGDAYHWLLFHTGCHFVSHPGEAHFALINDSKQCPNLADFHQGTAEYPEASTTVLIQVPSLTAGNTVQLHGPGINEQVQISPQVPAHFWPQWQQNVAAYPLGVDVVLICNRQLLGLPRTTQIQAPMLA